MQITIPTLETARLRLVPPQLSHLDVYASLYSDPDVMRHIGEPMDRATSWRLLATHAGHWVLYGFGSWCIEETESGEVIGLIGLKRTEGSVDVEMGWILSPKKWGKGYATEASRAVLAYAADHAGATRIAAHITPGNSGSISVARRLGMQLDLAVSSSPVLVYVHYFDSVIADLQVELGSLLKPVS